LSIDAFSRKSRPASLRRSPWHIVRGAAGSNDIVLCHDQLYLKLNGLRERLTGVNEAHVVHGILV
jgi:hypothetical protein